MAKKSVDARIAELQREIAEIRIRNIEAGEFRLVDKSGRVRAVLEMTRSGPRLAMMDEEGTIGLEITLAAGGPGIRLADEDGKTRAFIGAARDAASIALADGKGAQRVFVGVGRSGTPSIKTYDAKQRVAWSVAE